MARAAVFALYIQNIKLQGGNRTFPQNYISRRIIELKKKTHV